MQPLWVSGLNPFSAANMNLIKSIIENDGRLDEPMLAEVARNFPHAKVFVKWADGASATTTAADAITQIANAALNGNAVHQLQMSSASLECLCDGLGEFCWDTLGGIEASMIAGEENDAEPSEQECEEMRTKMLYDFVKEDRGFIQNAGILAVFAALFPDIRLVVRMSKQTAKSGTVPGDAVTAVSEAESAPRSIQMIPDSVEDFGKRYVAKRIADAKANFKPSKPLPLP